MANSAIWHAAQRKDENPLVPTLRGFDHRTRRAMYSAANRGILKRKTWDGCVVNRAALVMGSVVKGQTQASELFHVPVRQVVQFIATWDRLPGSDWYCTNMLRDALLEVGLFPHTDPAMVDNKADAKLILPSTPLQRVS